MNGKNIKDTILINFNKEKQQEACAKKQFGKQKWIIKLNQRKRASDKYFFPETRKVWNFSNHRQTILDVTLATIETRLISYFKNL